jgi:hypothetical protein
MSKECRAKQNASSDFADHSRLTQAREEIAENMSSGDKKR